MIAFAVASKLAAGLLQAVADFLTEAYHATAGTRVWV